MSNDYAGSIAQQFVHFTTTQSIITNPGATFGRAMMFLDQTTASGGLWLGSALLPGEDFELTAQNYAALTGGALRDILAGYFATNQIASMMLAIWDSAAGAYAGLISAYDELKYDAYFKTMYLAGLGNEAVQNAAAAKLAELGFPDTGIFTQVGFGTKVADNLDDGSTTSLTYVINQSSGDAVIVYGDASQNTDPWLDQLGVTLGGLNGTGTAIGNALDMIATATREASGTDGANLGPVDVAALKAQFVGYWSTLGNNSGQVALYNPKTIKEAVYAADWFVAYLNFVMSIAATEWLTDPATPQGKRRNNANYQAILGIIGAKAGPFTEKGGIGVIDGFTTAVAPAFKDLPASGDAFVIPHAWEATFVQNAREITVQGTLYIQA